MLHWLFCTQFHIGCQLFWCVPNGEWHPPYQPFQIKVNRRNWSNIRILSWKKKLSTQTSESLCQYFGHRHRFIIINRRLTAEWTKQRRAITIMIIKSGRIYHRKSAVVMSLDTATILPVFFLVVAALFSYSNLNAHSYDILHAYKLIIVDPTFFFIRLNNKS